MAKTKVISDLFSPIEISMEFMTVLFANESDEKFPVNCIIGRSLVRRN